MAKLAYIIQHNKIPSTHNPPIYPISEAPRPRATSHAEQTVCSCSWLRSAPRIEVCYLYLSACIVLVQLRGGTAVCRRFVRLLSLVRKLLSPGDSRRERGGCCRRRGCCHRRRFSPPRNSSPKRVVENKKTPSTPDKKSPQASRRALTSVRETFEKLDSDA